MQDVSFSFVSDHACASTMMSLPDQLGCLVVTLIYLNCLLQYQDRWQRDYESAAMLHASKHCAAERGLPDC